jgi:hypothetical protein
MGHIMLPCCIGYDEKLKRNDEKNLPVVCCCCKTIGHPCSARRRRRPHPHRGGRRARNGRLALRIPSPSTRSGRTLYFGVQDGGINRACKGGIFKQVKVRRRKRRTSAETPDPENEPPSEEAPKKAKTATRTAPQATASQSVPAKKVAVEKPTEKQYHW